MSITKPDAVFGRTHEWDDLTRFATDPTPGLQIGVVRGRRRHGKSFLLEHLCEAVGGLYTLALRQSRTMALARFTESLAQTVGYRLGVFSDWVQALDTAVEVLSRGARDGPPLLVLDEFPYLVDHSPELPSAIQALYDRRGPRKGHPPAKLILCGSAISVMSTLLAGDQALRGRAVLDLRIGPFGFRDAADYWEAEPGTAFLVDAVLGGAPGYRDIVGDAPGTGAEAFFRWLERTVLNPSHILFTEPDYLLAEDPRIGDRAIYHAIWQAVSGGASSPTQIGGLVGMDAKALTYHLNIMRDAAFISYGQDLLLQRRPVITVADPAVRFHNLIVQPNLIDLELRHARPAWERSRKTFSDKILGPHFEEIARSWVRRHGAEAGLDDVGQVGTTEVACREHRGHEVDVIALSRSAMARARGGRITVLGEAKCTAKQRTLGDLLRLEHIRDLLTAAGWNAAETRFVLFSRNGFSPDLRGAAASERVHLLDLDSLYGDASVRAC
ncbi:ATP-binding protein [Nonomuraea sp. NPDC050383]|uniref:ATP-binding protein n=1 Tax=Nonomuraea sp. NPDC050383 TaxID=3364362 RepID=UPI00379970C1